MGGSDEQRLLERLLVDAAFRARFQVDPAGAARAAGFLRLADELAGDDPAPLQALDARESRSSLAGALVAAAAEGFALVELGGGLFGAEDAQAAVGSPAANGRAVNPDWYGLAGTGGPVTPEADALLHNEHISWDAAGIADLEAGRMDPRVTAVLTEVSRDHDLVITGTSSDHPMQTTGGSVSNHYYGRALDIGSVDGKPVNAANGAARELALALASLDPSIRPSEIGSPWPLPGAAYFSDGDHQDHLHVGFDDPIQPGWKVPAAAAGPAPAGVVASSDGSDEIDADDEDEDDGASALPAKAAASPAAAAAPLSTDPDDWEGNLDDEDGGADEVDGSNEDEADESGGEDDDSGEEDDDEQDDEDEDDDDEDDDDEEEDEDEDEEDEDEDEGADEPGEGSNGEDATDDNAESDSDDGDDSDDGSDPVDSGDDGDSSDTSDGSDSGDDDSSDDSDGGDSGESSPDAGDELTPSAEYPGDDSSREEAAAWMAAKAQERGLPPELPVMASLVESGLRNLSYGDADSVGFFQMRTSIWDQGAYAGYQDRPDLQLQWFLDRAEAVKNARVDAGQPVDDPRSFGEWIADVERPAEQYRGRYQLRLEEARALLEVGKPGTSSAVGSAANEAQVLKVVDPGAADSGSG